MSTSSTTTTEVHGSGLEISTRTSKHTDYVAVAGGALAVVCAFVGLLLIARMRTRAVRFVIFAVLLALGGLQLVRGFWSRPGRARAEPRTRRGPSHRIRVPAAPGPQRGWFVALVRRAIELGTLRSRRVLS